MNERRGTRPRLTAALLTAQILLAGPLAAQPREPAREPAPGAREAATQRFLRGVELRRQQRWAEALAELLESRRLFPGSLATANAAFCLSQLGRHDEALELYASLLEDFGDRLTPAEKRQAVDEMERARSRVGDVDVAGAEPGAVVTIDGRRRGAYPLPALLRVAEGSHLVRVFKQGYEPFEARVEVAGGALARVEARLTPLARAGKLRVAELRGRALTVVVDGNAVGEAPWEGLLAPGEHVILLRGQGSLGTPPVSVAVDADRPNPPLTLAAEELSASLRIEPVPVNATVAIDKITVGRGVWEGRLRAGKHTVEVGAAGFVATAREVDLAGARQPTLRIELGRDPRSVFAASPRRFTVEVTDAALFAPLFGGTVASGCAAPCSRTTGLGGYVLARGGVAWASGVGAGITAGYLAATQSTAGRSTTVTPVRRPGETVAAADSIWVQGALLGVWGSFSSGGVHLRLGAGALLGAATDERTAASSMASVGPASEVHRLSAFYLAPEVRVGFAVTRHVELSLGVEMLAAFAPAPPRWSDTHDVIISRPAGGRGHLDYGTYPAESFTSPILAFAPGLAARYTF